MSLAAVSLAETSPREELLKRRVPAWFLSLTLHLAAVLAGSLLARGSHLPDPGEETERPAAIVLARRADNKKTNYFTPEEMPTQTNPAAENSTSPSASAFGDPLPAASEPPPLSSVVRLPELPGTLAPGKEMVVVKPLATGDNKRSISRLTEADKAAILAEDAARPRLTGPAGPTAAVSLFGSKGAVGRSFVFLIDRSQSMGGDGLGVIEAAAKELAASIGSLEETHKFQVIAYNQKPLHLTGKELLPATAGNKQQLIDFVKNLPAFGATEHEVGIYAALKLKPDVIFLLSDGGDPMLNAGQLKGIRAAARGTTIHCLHFGSGAKVDERNFLETLAEYTSGSYLYIDMADRR